MASQLVRFKTAKHTFEVMTKPGAVLKYREGTVGYDNVLMSDMIFKNQAKAERAKTEDLKEAFNTENVEEIIKIILEKGELQLSAAERKEKVDRKRAEIVNYIHKYFIDPRNKLPHPVTRIELALDELKIRVDGEIPAERQAQDVIKRLPDVLPIKKCEMEGQLIVPHKVLAQAMGIVAKWCTIQRESYTADGCTMDVAVVPGDYDTLMLELHKVTKGEFSFEIAGQAAKAVSQEADTRPKPSGSGAKGKGKGKK